MTHRMQWGLYGIVVLSLLGAGASCSSGGSASSVSGDATPSGTVASASLAAAGSVAQRPAWATSQRLVGEVAAEERLSIQVHLQMKDPAAAAEELSAISNPQNPRYGQFLSDADYEAKYAPTEAGVNAVRAHLEENGLRVTHVPGNRTFVSAVGTAAQVGRAFSTRLGLYQVGSETRRAPIDPPTVPDWVAPHVVGILGLATPLKMTPHNVVGGIRRDSLRNPNGPPQPVSPGAIGGNGTCSEWFGSLPDTADPPYGPGYPALTFAPCGYVPAQIREAYGFTKSIRNGNDGTGVAVAVVDAYLSPTLLSDVQTYAAQNDPDYPLVASQLSMEWAPGTATYPDSDWYIEQTLDVEAVHAIAPGATIVAVAAQSQSDQDIIAALNLVIERKLATIVSNSYETQTEASLTDALIWESLATQAGLKGVGLYFSSGDSGDYTGGWGMSPTIAFPGSLPTITSVGGTSLALGNLGQRLWETGWETGMSYLETYIPPPPPFEGGFGEGGFGPPPFEGGFADAGTGPSQDASIGDPVTRIVLSRSADPQDDAGGSDAEFLPDEGSPIVQDASWDPSPPGSFAYGGGGGVSILFPQPKYQKNIVPSSIANLPGVPARVIPDVSMVADPVTGFVIGTTQYTGGYQEMVIGGTSLSSPLFAGVMALAQQHSKRTFGFANALLYSASSKGAFTDALPLSSPQAVAIEQGVVATFGFDQLSIHTTLGYDDVTGLGSPNGQLFLNNVK